MNLMINLLFRLTLPKIIYRNILSKLNIDSYANYYFFLIIAYDLKRKFAYLNFVTIP